MRQKAKEPTPLFLTDQAISNMKQELARIESDILPEIRRRMANAYEDGDIPENNPFITANEDLQEAMKRRNNLREILLRAKLYKPRSKKKTIHLGSHCRIKLGNQIHDISLVSSEESDPVNRKISIDSPLGRALLGRLPGESIEFETPSGKQAVVLLAN